MKAVVPYLLLGLIGSVGAAFGTGMVKGGGGAAPPVGAAPPPAPTTTSGAVKVHASLDRTALPAAGGEVFARIALEGVMPTGPKSERVPVSLTLVIDRSGSMGSGNKMEDAKTAAIRAIQSLAPGDRVAVVSFDDGAVLHGSATLPRDPTMSTRSGEEATVQHLVDAIAGLTARSGTDMVAGLERGLEGALQIKDAQRVNRLLLLSDGRPNTETGLTDLVKKLLASGVQTTTLGLGADYNEDLMAQLADAGLGHYFFVEKPEQLAGIFTQELESLATVVAREAVIELAPAPGASIAEVIGFRFDRSGDRVIIPAGDVYGGRTTDVLVRLRAPAGTGSRDVVTATVAFHDVKEQQRAEERRVLAALFTADGAQVEASAVPAVQAKAEKWRAAQAYVAANDAYNRGDVAGGDKILLGSRARLEEKAAALNDTSLQEEAVQQEAYQKLNQAGGASWRGIGSKEAKKRAWSMNKGSAY